MSATLPRKGIHFVLAYQWEGQGQRGGCTHALAHMGALCAQLLRVNHAFPLIQRLTRASRGGCLDSPPRGTPVQHTRQVHHQGTPVQHTQQPSHPVDKSREVRQVRTKWPAGTRSAHPAVEPPSSCDKNSAPGTHARHGQLALAAHLAHLGRQRLQVPVQYAQQLRVARGRDRLQHRPKLCDLCVDLQAEMGRPQRT